MKIFNFANKGVIMALALMLLASFDAAFGYAGIVKLSKSAVLGGVSEIRLISGGRPSQVSNANLTAGTNYSVDTTSDSNYNIYNIYDTPSDPTYLLLLKGASNYSIVGAPMGTTVPVTTAVNSATFYKTGQPVAPAIGTIVAGYETAKVPLSYDPNYEYAGVDIQIASDSGFTSLLKDAGGNSTASSGPVGQYLIGELIDGRILQSGSTYYFGVVGKVAGVANSAQASKSFSMKSGGGTGGGWSVGFNLVGGINTISIPFDSAKETNLKIGDVIMNLNSAGSPITIANLLKAITVATPQGITNPPVTVVGFFDAATQRHVGLAAITYSGPDINGGTPFGSDASGKNYTWQQIAGMTIAKGQAIQITVNRALNQMSIYQQ